MRHTDGTPHSASVPVSVAPSQPGLVRGPLKGVVLATHLVGQTGNRHAVGVECVVVLYNDRRILRHVPVEQRGGYDTVGLWIPRPTTQAIDTGDVMAFDPGGAAPSWLESASLKDLDGDHVVVDFFGGDPNDPTIRSSRAHPRGTWIPDVATATALGAFARIAQGTAARFEVGTSLRVQIGANVEIYGVEVIINGTAVSVTGDEISLTSTGPVSISGATVGVAATGAATIDGDTVTINGGDKGVARLDDAVEVDPLDAAVNTEWATWIGKVHTAVAVLDPSLVQPTSALVGSITEASTTVKAG